MATNIRSWGILGNPSKEKIEQYKNMPVGSFRNMVKNLSRGKKGKVLKEFEVFVTQRDIKLTRGVIKVEAFDWSEAVEHARLRQEEEQLKKLTKDAKEIVIVDNESYYVSVPLNYGGSCRLARSVGEFANWCTGTTSSNHYFNHYSKQGPLIVFIDKNNPDNKYQLHAPSDQFKDKKDAEIDRENFAKRYPNAMNDIIDGLQANADKLTDYQNMPAQIKLVQNRFKSAFGKANDLEGGDPDWIAANR